MCFNFLQLLLNHPRVKFKPQCNITVPHRLAWLSSITAFQQKHLKYIKVHNCIMDKEEDIELSVQLKAVPVIGLVIAWTCVVLHPTRVKAS